MARTTAALGLAAGGLGILAIAVGAIAAHAGMTDTDATLAEIGVRYHLPHLVAAWAALIGAALVGDAGLRRALHLAAGFWMLGILGFSGGLYVTAFFGWHAGLVTPAGGFAFMFGWACAGFAAWRAARAAAQ